MAVFLAGDHTELDWYGALPTGIGQPGYDDFIKLRVERLPGPAQSHPQPAAVNEGAVPGWRPTVRKIFTCVQRPQQRPDAGAAALLADP